MSSARLGVVLLAAGASTRLGQPKQLLDWRGKSLVRHAAILAAEIAAAKALEPVIVVTGAVSEEVQAELDGLAVRAVHNPAWGEGMASSIQVGLQALGAETGGVLLLLCDQPLITGEDLASLVNVWQNQPHCPAVARYADIIGVPAIVPAALFAELQNLQGDRGAAAWLRQYEGVNCVDMPHAAVDIDVAGDLVLLQVLQD
jgi:molybdenum cofactor cytidylyltransferase